MDHKDQVKWLRFLKFLQEKNSCPLYEGVKTEIRGSHLIKYSEGLMGVQVYWKHISGGF